MYCYEFMKLVKNSAQCLGCGDVIESKHRHDFVSCSCKNLSVDGGLSYARRLYHNPEDVKDLSVYEVRTKFECLEIYCAMTELFLDKSSPILVEMREAFKAHFGEEL